MLLLGFVLLAICHPILCGDEAANTPTTTPKGDSPHSSSASTDHESNVTTTHTGPTTTSGHHENNASTETPFVDPKIFTKEYKSTKLVMRRISPKENNETKELCAKNTAFNPVYLRLPGVDGVTGEDGLCAATLISSRHLLTTRTCFIDLEATNGTDGNVELAWHLVDDPHKYQLPTDFERAFYVWNAAGEDERSVDIALIQLLEDIDFSKTKVRPACLPVPKSEIGQGTFTVPVLEEKNNLNHYTFEPLGKPTPPTKAPGEHSSTNTGAPGNSTKSSTANDHSSTTAHSTITSKPPSFRRRRRDAAASSTENIESVLGGSETYDEAEIPPGAVPVDADNGTITTTATARESSACQQRPRQMFSAALVCSTPISQALSTVSWRGSPTAHGSQCASWGTMASSSTSASTQELAPHRVWRQSVITRTACRSTWTWPTSRRSTLMSHRRPPSIQASLHHQPRPRPLSSQETVRSLPPLRTIHLPRRTRRLHRTPTSPKARRLRQSRRTRPTKRALQRMLTCSLHPEVTACLTNGHSLPYSC